MRKGYEKNTICSASSRGASDSFHQLVDRFPSIRRDHASRKPTVKKKEFGLTTLRIKMS